MRARKRAAAGGVQAEKQQRYGQLIGQGVDNSEACRLVGIDRKTGNRWRYGRQVRNSAGALVIYPPVQIKPARPRSPRYLSEHERIRIADLLRARMTVRAISRRARTRTLDDQPGDPKKQRAGRAVSPASRRTHCPAAGGPATPASIAIDIVLAETVGRLRAKRWSPEQVAHELRVLFVDQPLRWLCKESIYQAIYDSAVQITRPARRRRRRRRLLGLQRRGRLTAMRMIHERPTEVQDRVQAGHWEGDLIMRAGNRSAIGTLVERPTRFVILLPFPDAIATTGGVRHAITGALQRLPPSLTRTLTWDQGKELALHQQITAATGSGVFFCDPHSPWQRGSNENMNGLLRDYFPSGTDLSVHTVEDLARVATEVNERPRKTLGWARPIDLFTAALGSG
ncbi:MAG: IS30 family transposase [Acetobacteraceae bacterium]|nr:IS30 family transposase [Acetobacteraceae bacterium]